MFYWIYELSTPTVALLMTVVFVGVSWLGATIMRPIMRLFVRSRSGEVNDIVGYCLSCFSRRPQRATL